MLSREKVPEGPSTFNAAAALYGASVQCWVHLVFHASKEQDLCLWAFVVLICVVISSSESVLMFVTKGKR